MRTEAFATIRGDKIIDCNGKEIGVLLPALSPTSHRTICLDQAITRPYYGFEPLAAVGEDTE